MAFVQLSQGLGNFGFASVRCILNFTHPTFLVPGYAGSPSFALIETYMFGQTSCKVAELSLRASDSSVYPKFPGDKLLFVVYVPLQHQALRGHRCADAGSVDRPSHRSGSVRNYFPFNEVTANRKGAARADC
jgi:hypothetical protein